VYENTAAYTQAHHSTNHRQQSVIRSIYSHSVCPSPTSLYLRFSSSNPSVAAFPRQLAILRAGISQLLAVPAAALLFTRSEPAPDLKELPRKKLLSSTVAHSDANEALLLSVARDCGVVAFVVGDDELLMLLAKMGACARKLSKNTTRTALHPSLYGQSFLACTTTHLSKEAVSYRVTIVACIMHAHARTRTMDATPLCMNATAHSNKSPTDAYAIIYVVIIDTSFHTALSLLVQRLYDCIALAHLATATCTINSFSYHIIIMMRAMIAFVHSADTQRLRTFS
jgi:hypothetical protein